MKCMELPLLKKRQWIQAYNLQSIKIIQEKILYVNSESLVMLGSMKTGQSLDQSGLTYQRNNLLPTQ